MNFGVTYGKLDFNVLKRFVHLLSGVIFKPSSVCAFQHFVWFAMKGESRIVVALVVFIRVEKFL